MLGLIDRHVAAGQSFSLETTLSGRGYAQQIPEWRQRGDRVELIFLSLPSADIAVQRVRERVQQGGHDIPEATIRRRFNAGLRMFTDVYQPLIDTWGLYCNLGNQPLLLEWSSKS